MGIDEKLMEILACPDCKTKVIEADGGICCTNADCRRRYEISEGIPVMLVDESTVLEPPKWSELTQ
jgi:uncharacterized protein YbaR (Trm112 family)